MQGIPLARALKLRRAAFFVALVALLFPACDGDDDPGAATKQSPDPVYTGGRGPYVSVAVDNHFHDVHPADDKKIDDDVAFVVRNEGSNLHNVTFVGLDISKDIEPGESFRVDPVRKLGGLGSYDLFCKYHAEEGMRGTFTVVEETS